MIPFKVEDMLKKLLFSILLIHLIFYTAYSQEGIRELLEKVKNAPPEERYIYMNRLKLKLRELKEEQRKEIIRKLYRELSGKEEMEHKSFGAKDNRRDYEISGDEKRFTPKPHTFREEHEEEKFKDVPFSPKEEIEKGFFGEEDRNLEGGVQHEHEGRESEAPGNEVKEDISDREERIREKEEDIIEERRHGRKHRH